MPRRNPAVRERHAPALAVRHNRLDLRLMDFATGAREHPRIGFDHAPRRVDRGRLRVQEANLVERHDVLLERGNGLTIEKLAGDSVFSQKGLLLLRRADGVAGPRLQPTGLTDAL